jgi:hypothetical protein
MNNLSIAVVTIDETVVGTEVIRGLMTSPLSITAMIVGKSAI